MRRTTVRPRTYEVVEEFSMDGVEVKAVWQITVSDKFEHPSARVYVGVNKPTTEAVTHSGDRADVDMEDVPRHVLEAVENAALDDFETVLTDND